MAAPELFDNVQWVATHQQHLSPTDQNATFRYVTSHHPWFGMAFHPSATFSHQRLRLWSLERLAKLADAVAVCCYEVLGTSETNISLTTKHNETSIGGAAFIAIHHSDPAVRERFTTAINRWRKAAR